MNSGYDIFGTAYGVMFRHDLHAPGSVDDLFLQRMCLLEEESVDALYTAPPVISPAITTHELYPLHSSLWEKMTGRRCKICFPLPVRWRKTA